LSLIGLTGLGLGNSTARLAWVITAAVAATLGKVAEQRAQ